MKKYIMGGMLTAVALTTAVLIAGTGTVCAIGTNSMVPVSTPSLKVADIYHATTVSNWKKVASNVNAIYIKASEGTTKTDMKYTTYANSAKNAGIKYGFFHYFWPYNDTSNAVKQADKFYKLISSYPYSCVPALDVEEVNGLTKAKITADIKAFAAEFKRLSNQDIIIYTYNYFINDYLDSSLSKYKLWVANYKDKVPQKTNVWNKWTMWQYTGTGKITGFSGIVDCNKATDGIYLNSADSTNTSSGDGYSLVIDKHYTNSGGNKYFKATAMLDGGTMMSVTTLNTGEQTIQYQPLSDTPKKYTVYVGSKAVKTAVYLIKGQISNNSGSSSDSSSSSSGGSSSSSSSSGSSSSSSSGSSSGSGSNSGSGSSSYNVPVTYGLTQFVTDK